MLFVSFIVPVYNCEHFISTTIESILQQKGLAFELLLIDDGSSDTSGRICDDYAVQDKRIRVFHQKNQGVSAARNKGIHNAQGKYLWFVDGDDRIDTHALEILKVPIMGSFEIISFGWEIINDNKTVSKQFYDGFSTQRREELKPMIMNSIELLSSACNKLFLAEWLNNSRLEYDISRKINEDTIFCYQAYTRVNRVLNLSECLYYYCQRADSASHQAHTDIIDAFLVKKISLIEMLQAIGCEGVQINAIVERQFCNAVGIQFEIAQMHQTLSHSERKTVLYNLFKDLELSQHLQKWVKELPFSLHKLLDIISMRTKCPDLCLAQFYVSRWLERKNKNG